MKIEDPGTVFFVTTRTIASRLWFVHNPKLEERILALLARYAEMYSVDLFAFIIMGNHYHLIARFPKCNRKAFFRIFNSMIAKVTATQVVAFEGKLWARRYAEQTLPNNEDIEHYFFYSALNPIASGLTRDLSEYHSYNSFLDAADGRERTFKFFERSAFNEALRRGQNSVRENFIKTYTLQYKRIPGYEQLAGPDYRKMLLRKLQQKRLAVIEKRLLSRKGFAKKMALINTKAGQKPKFTKKSERKSYRPLVLTLCSKTKESFLNWYFAIRDKFLKASAAFRAGHLMVEFPPGTYRPISYCH